MAAGSENAIEPIGQFAITRLIDIRIGGLDFSFTNSALFMVASVAVGALGLLYALRGRGLVPGRGQLVAEMAYEMVADMLRASTGNAGMRFFPLVFSLFAFILIANMLGMVPIFFTVTSHIIVTFALAMLVIGVVLVSGFMRHGLKFLKIFVPSGIPWVLMPLVSVIEIISFISRPVSLSVRLFANMLAGHITLKVFAGFVVLMTGAGFIGTVGAILPLVMTVALTALEFLVAFLQAYVFAILTCMYLGDAIHGGH